MRTRPAARGFSLIEVATVMMIISVISAIALPQITQLAKTREKERSIEQAGALLERARDVARREMLCAGVNYTPGVGLRANTVDCATGVESPVLVPGIAPVEMDPALVASVTTGPVPQCCFSVVFDRNGHLAPVGAWGCEPNAVDCYGGKREINIDFVTGERFTQEIYPAVGAVRRVR